MRSWLAAVALAVPGWCAAWSEPTAELARRAESQFPGRIVVVATLEEAARRRLPAATRHTLLEVERTVFPRALTRGVTVPFRWHWLDAVRCGIYVPADARDPGAELWAMAHEIGHCVARLGGWQDSLWRDADVVARHRTESWADAFALILVAPEARPAAGAEAMRRRALEVADAAYFTDAAIRCSYAAPPAGPDLRAVGRLVERTLTQSGCHLDAASLRAAQGFLASIPERAAAP